MSKPKMGTADVADLVFSEAQRRFLDPATPEADRGFLRLVMDIVASEFDRPDEEVVEEWAAMTEIERAAEIARALG